MSTEGFDAVETVERLLEMSEESMMNCLRRSMAQRHFRVPSWVDDPAVVDPEGRDSVVEGMRSTHDADGLCKVWPRFWIALLREKRTREDQP